MPRTTVQLLWGGPPLQNASSSTSGNDTFLRLDGLRVSTNFHVAREWSASPLHGPVPDPGRDLLSGLWRCHGRHCCSVERREKLNGNLGSVRPSGPPTLTPHRPRSDSARSSARGVASPRSSGRLSARHHHGPRARSHAIFTVPSGGSGPFDPITSVLFSGSHSRELGPPVLLRSDVSHMPRAGRSESDRPPFRPL